MKWRFFLLTLFLSGTMLAQSGSTLRFDRMEWDFGTIYEVDGTVHYRFEFTNIGAQAVVVERVTTDCGCTTPSYSREPVRPGGRGWIEVAFDPKGAWGRLTKSVVVFSNGGQGTALQVKVNIVPRAKTINESYPVELGEGVRVSSLSEAFGYIAVGTTVSRVVEIVNTGERSATIEAAVSGNGQFTVACPKQLARNQQAQITVTYNFSGRPIYGIFSDRIILKINGLAAELPIYATAISTDNFTGIDPATAAHCNIVPRFHNFGPVRAGTTVNRDFIITNTGRKPLIIRAVSQFQSNITFSLPAGTVIGVGKSVTATLTFIIPESYGSVAGGVALITNDPSMPLQEIRVVAEIKN